MADQEYDNTNSGALFQAKEKRTAKSPDYSGNLDVEGQEYWISGWKRKSKAGKVFLSLALTKKEVEVDPSTLGDSDDDVPF